MPLKVNLQMFDHFNLFKENIYTQQEHQEELTLGKFDKMAAKRSIVIFEEEGVFVKKNIC